MEAYSILPSDSFNNVHVFSKEVVSAPSVFIYDLDAASYRSGKVVLYPVF